MHQGKLVFSQLMAYLPMSTFRRCVAKHRGEHKVKDFSCLDQSFAMAFAQLTYLDFTRLYVIHQAQAFFVTRVKSNTQFRRRYSNPVDRGTTSIICDQIGVLTVYYSSKDYPSALRRVVAKDETGKRITFLTNTNCDTH
jgi:hypothetical protein